MKAVITGGGTGGHIYPALSVADKLNSNGWEIIYIGSKDSLEKKIVNGTKYRFKNIQVLPLPRKLNTKFIRSIYISFKAVIKSYRFLKNINPDIVFGTGGYVTGPILLGAFLNGIPTVIHEQNIYPGITNKLLSYCVSKVAVNNLKAAEYFPKVAQKKLIETGNPIRDSILSIDREKSLKKLELNPNYKTLFIMGGSQGSQTLNQAFLEVADDLINFKDLQIILITGPNNYSELIDNIENRDHNRLLIFSYLDNIEDAYAVADLIVYRAGATGLSEITALGIPAVLVPYPYSAEGHQEVNAKFLEDSDAAVMVKDQDFNGKILLKLVKEILYDQKRLEEMSKNSKRLAKLNASDKIVDIIENLVREE